MTNAQRKCPKKREGDFFPEKVIVMFWCIAVWLVVMNTTMFNVALPSLSNEFALTPTAASWIVTGYSIVFGISSITYSRLTDFLSIRKLVLFGILLMGVSSLLGYFAHHYVLLMAARILQAVGAASFPGLGMVLFSRYIPAERRGRAMSAIASSVSLGFGLGPLVGGALTQFLGWNYLFVLTGLVLFTMPFFQKHLPAEHDKSVRFDFFGSLLVALGTTGLLLFVTTFSPWLLALGLGAVGLLWRHVHRVQTPFIQPEILRNKAFTQLIGIGFAGYFINFATLFCLPIMLAQIFHLSSMEIGLVIFPGAIIAATATKKIGALIDQYGNVVVLRGGILLILLSVVLFSTVSSLSVYMIVFSYLFMNLGFSALVASNSNELSLTLVKKHVGAGMGINQLVSFFGGAFGVGVTSMLMVVQKGMGAGSVFQNIYAGLCILPLVSFYLLRKYVESKKVQIVAS